MSMAETRKYGAAATADSNDGLDFKDNIQSERARLLGSGTASNSSAKPGVLVTAQLVGAALAAVVSGSGQFGYATGMLNNIRPVIVSDFQSNTSCQQDFDVPNLATAASKRNFDFATSLFCVGGLIGSLAGGWLADTVGRKYSLLLNNVFALAGGLLMAFARSYGMLIGGRIVEGIAGGIAMVVVSAYLGEIAPTSVRGAVGTLSQFTISSAIFLATALGLPYLLGTCAHWHLVVGAPVALAVIQLCSLPFFPRSPRYLYIDKNNLSAAEHALRRLRPVGVDLAQELAEMKAEKEKLDRLARPSVFQVLRSRQLRFRFVLTAILHTSQQFTGINGVFYYSSAIYTSAGLKNVALFALLPAVLNVLFVGVSVKLVDRLGRRSLMVIGLAGMCCSYVILTAGMCFNDGFFSGKSSSSSGGNWTAALTITGSLGVVAFFSVGPGPVPWMIVNELFPQSTRATAYAFAGVVNWTANYLVGQFFLPILNGLHPYGFLVFAAVSLLYALLLYYLQPETKGVEIDDIDAYFNSKAEGDEASALSCCFLAGKDTLA